MRVTKAIVVTTGAVALAAAGATPAFAAASTPEIGAAAPMTHVLSQGKHHASDATARGGWQQYQSESGGSWGAPWENNPAPILGVLDDSVTNVAPWEICGSTVVAGIGGSVPINSPNVVLGDCNNANTILIAH
jgi:hypothetical protein